ncbi:MAG: fibronectin type III domain-containing protein [Calditrichaeota bacterium]|nr:fibronectin type III domain-containing protein [Calditrichota bacterium]
MAAGKLVFLWFAIAGWLLLSGCAERERKNPFDPGADQESPVRLSLKPTETAVVLEWEVEPISHVVGFRIYRSVDDNRHFQLYQEVGSDHRVFLDSNVEPYRWYYYRVTALGPATESLPSNTEKTYLGKGKIYLISHYGFWVRQLSYDLLHTLNQFDTRFPPVEWAPYLKENIVWLAYGPYRYIGRIHLSLAKEEDYFDDVLKIPIDVEVDPRNGNLFVLDDGTNELIQINNLTVTHRVELPPNVYIRMTLQPEARRMGILGESLFLWMSLDSRAILFTHSLPETLSFQDQAITRDTIYLLATALQSQSTRLITLSPTTGETTDRWLNGIFHKIAVDNDQQVFYLAQITDIRRPDTQQRLVKLSFNGDRLLELDNFNFIADIQINPYDNSVVVVDRLKDRLFLIRTDGKIISESIKLYDPIRVHIE